MWIKCSGKTRWSTAWIIPAGAWHARDTRIDYKAEPLCGADLARELKSPISALIAEGSQVTIHWRTAIES
jgi:hypothetical protein